MRTYSVSSDDSSDKENTAPKSLAVFNQTRKIAEALDEVKSSTSSKDNRVITKALRGNTPVSPVMTVSSSSCKMEGMALAPLSNSTTVDDNNHNRSYGETALLNVKHAWPAVTPSNDRKVNKGRSLPVLHGSNVTVDSPDPTSKFYVKSPSINKFLDSPDSDGSYLAMHDAVTIANNSPVIPGTEYSYTFPLLYAIFPHSHSL